MLGVGGVDPVDRGSVPALEEEPPFHPLGLSSENVYNPCQVQFPVYIIEKLQLKKREKSTYYFSDREIFTLNIAWSQS